MSFEEWWKTKDYPTRCKGNCKEAYEAGIHADVHTDNSAVIAELEKENERLTVSYETLKLHDEEEIGMLKSENAELKEKLKPENCLKLLAKDGYVKFTSDKLTKATEIIKKLCAVYYDPCVTESDLKYRDELFTEMKQFLKDSEVEND